MKSILSTNKLILIYILSLLICIGKIAWGLTPAQLAELAYQEGQRQELSRQFKKAAEYYQEAVKQDGKNSQYQYKLAYVYTQLPPSKIQEAIGILNRLTKIDPRHKAAYSLLGRLHLQQREIEKAEAAFQNALKIDSNFAEPHFFLGEIWGQRTMKGEHTGSPLQQSIDHYQTYLRLAIRGEFIDQAQERWRELQYGNAGVRLNLAIATIRNREYDRALKILNELLQSSPTTASESRRRYLQQEAHYWRGLIYSISESYPHYDRSGEKSKREWLMAPDIPAARVELGNWYYQIGNVQDAIEQLEAAVRLDISGWLAQRTYFYLGKAYMQSNRAQKALVAFQKAKSLDPNGEFADEAKAFIELLSGKTTSLSQVSDSPLWSQEQWSDLKQRFLRQYGNEVKDIKQQQRLENILTRILVASNLSFGSYPYAILILDNPEKNAWGLPGGQIFLSSGLLRLVQTKLQDSDDVLAFIIAHEMAHLVNRDLERSEEGIRIIEAVSAGKELPMTSLQHGFSRVAELRADKYGALLAYSAKFDPTAAIRWCETVIATDGDIDPNGSYPTFKERQESLKWYLTSEIQVAYGKFRSGVDAFRKGDYNIAIEDFTGYLSYFPYDKHALNNLGVVYHQQAVRKSGGSPHGEWRLSIGVEVQPDLPPLTIRGNPPQVPMDKELLRKAIFQFESALRVDRRYKVAYKNLGDVYGDLGEFDQAKEAYQQALRLDPQYVEAHNSLGVLLCRQNQVERGIEAFQQALRLAKNHLEARYNLALAHEVSAQKEKAKQAWQEYLKFDDKSGWADKAKGHLRE